jgi:general secretion pathway protein F
LTRFTYKAVSPSGEVIEGDIEAASREMVVERLRRQGHVPIRAEPRKAAPGPTLSGLFKPRRISPKDLVHLTQELATLLQAGLPLDRALTVLGDLTRAGPGRAMVGQIYERVRGGATLADALEQFPDVFANFYSGLVRAGEAGGSLELVLARLAESLERAQTLRENVRSALMYPAIVLIMAVLSLAVLMTLVIPEFRPLFEDAGAEMPLATQVVIWVSDIFSAYWWAMVAVVLAAVVILHRYNRDPKGRLRWDGWMIRLPLFGDLIRKAETARFCRTFGTLLTNGVTMLNALSMTVETLENRAIAEAVGALRGRLERGEGLADPLSESGVFPHLALQLIQVGEETGEMEPMLMRVADIYDTEVQRTIQRLLSLLVPLITIGLGVLIAVIIGSILSAILGTYDLPL